MLGIGEGHVFLSNVEPLNHLQRHEEFLFGVGKDGLAPFAQVPCYGGEFMVEDSDWLSVRRRSLPDCSDLI